MRTFQHPWAFPGYLLALFLLPVACLAGSTVKADSGKFTTTVQESLFATDTFVIASDGSSTFDETISIPAKVAIHCVLKTRNNRPVEIASSAPGHGKFVFRMNGAKGTLILDNKPAKQTSAPVNAYAFGNGATHLLSYMVAGYNAAKGGAQQFNIVVVEGTGPNGPPTTKATLAATGTALRRVAGKRITVRKYHLVIAGAIGNVDTDLLTDTAGRVLLWTVPGQKLVSVRQGYEDLTTSQSSENSSVSQPIYQVKIDRNVKIAMRDGVQLAADIYRPDSPGTFPVILQRTPYGRALAVEGTRYAKRGYVFVAQDVRGRGDSKGVFEPFVNESNDGYDSVEWCARQPWSTGNVGMIGGSYLGYVQWAAAREGSPHLKCIVPIVSPPDPFFNIPYAFGAFFLSPTLWWSAAVDNGATNITDPAKQLRDLKAFYTLPLTEVDKALYGHHLAFYQEALKHPTNDDYWQRASF
ncbi:MAG TPA: CocE/NonD family hydrolase, partial [Chthonomonadales bacterium]|nr:CocE/NonD family hydrolase [Chthonomonadales bacterium]